MMTEKEKSVSSALKTALERRKNRDDYTVTLYTLKTRRHPYGLPFVAFSDECALNALEDISRTVPEVQNSNLYKVGSFCCIDGKLLALSRPIQVSRRSE